MRNKLVWKDDTTRVVLKSNVVGQFARCATNQSPYIVPDKLADGIREFGAAIGHTSEYDFVDTTCSALEDIVCKAISMCTTVMEWNVPKSGKSYECVFVARNCTPNPDDDIIDVHALARNVAHGTWLELCYDDGWFE